MCKKICRLCMCCAFFAAVPLSVFVVAVALLVPRLMPQDTCTTDGSGACKLALEGTRVACEAGIFLEVAKQPHLGLVHVPLGREEVAVASLSSKGCVLTYAVTCGAGGVEVIGSSSCSGQEKEQSSLGETWEICAKGGELRLLTPVIDLVDDILSAPSLIVNGCIRLSPPSRLPHLGAVRGSIAEQKEALIEAKATVGGCATWRDEEDILGRGADYTSEFNRGVALTVGQLMKRALASVKLYKAGEPVSFDYWGLMMFAGTMAAGGGEAAGIVVASTMFCGAPGIASIPAINAIVVSRHADTAKLIADPHQKRIQQIGGGASEVCFEPTLPVFLSTGTPTHSQTRKLWDAVGLATMHLSDISEVVVPPENFIAKVRHMGMKAVGINHPLLDELALYVTPLFLEKLWGKKPTVEETAAIAAYGTVGGPCIMSQLVEKLPIVPGKIRAARTAALQFARESPIGKQMAQEIQKESYAELRALYASRPLGVVDGALGALTDASLFAGLIGTSTMTMNALLQVHRGSEYLRMFRQNSTAFMLEVMRTATAVAGSMQVTKGPWALNMLREAIELKPGVKIMQLTGMGAGLDGSVFPDPYKFDINRPNLGETQNFNGLSKYVLTQNYTGAPRYCPGAAVSIKIASKIVDHFTKDMA